jgi:hypothetical protein
MRFYLLSICILSVVLPACTPAGPTSITNTSTVAQVSRPGIPTSITMLASSTTIPPTFTANPTQIQEGTPNPTITLTEWQSVQKEVTRLRDLLDRQSDGYAGLTLALEQDAPNADWCGGLNAAIGDFNYAGDVASSRTLETLQESQACP